MTEDTTHVNNEGAGNLDKVEAGNKDNNGNVTRVTKQEEEKHKGDVLEAALAQLGHFRLYQKYVLLMMCIPNMLAAMYSLNYVFVADQENFRCTVPECEGNTNLNFDNELVLTLLPSSGRCSRYEPLNQTIQTCDPEDFGDSLVSCDAFIYETQYTVFSEFEMACREWMRLLVGTLRNTALPISLIITGYLSDAWGRRTAFCVFSGCMGVMGIIKGFSVNYNMYLTMEFFEAALGYGFTSAGYVMIIELARPSLRAAFACATGVAYGLGGVLFALIAWLVPYWRHLVWTIYTPALLFPLYWLIMDESPIWLYAKGRVEETQAVIKRAARWNKITVDPDLMAALGVNKSSDLDSQKESQHSTNPWLSLLRSKVLMTRFVICSFCWIATTFVYYGLTINSVSLSGDKYVNFALNMAMEIVASLLLIMMLERFGRKKCIFFAFLVCGVACVTPYFISNFGTGLGLFFLGKLAITFAFNSIYVFTAELFPTHTRSTALAACSLVGRIGSIIAPQTPLLGLYVQALLYGACSLLAACAVLFVPETRKMRLPQGVADAEVIKKDTLVIPAPVARTQVEISADT